MFTLTMQHVYYCDMFDKALIVIFVLGFPSSYHNSLIFLFRKLINVTQDLFFQNNVDLYSFTGFLIPTAFGYISQLFKLVIPLLILMFTIVNRKYVQVLHISISVGILRENFYSEKPHRYYLAPNCVSAFQEVYQCLPKH